MNIFWWSSFFGAITNFGIAFFILLILKGWRDPVKRIFSFTTISVALWSVGACIFSSASQARYQLAMFGWQVGYLGCSFVPVFFSHFVLKLLNLKKKSFIIWVYIINIIFNFFVWYDNSRFFLSDLKFVFNQFYWTDWLKNKSPLWLVYYLGLNVVLLTYVFALLLIAYKVSVGVRRNQLKYFIVGSVIAWFGAHGDYTIALGNPIYPYCNFLIAIYPAIWAYAIIKHHLLDIRVAITRTGIFLAVYTFVLGVPFWIGYQVLGKGFWIVPVSITVLLATSGPLIYRALRQKAEEKILAQQKYYQRILLHAAGGMVREHNLDRLLKLIVHIVKKVVRVEFAAVFLEDRENECYRLKAVRNHHNIPENLKFAYTHPLVELIKEKGAPLAYDEITPSVTDDFRKPVHLIVPSLSDKDIISFLVLGEKTDRSFYTEDDINVFRILSRQAALAIEHCFFLKEFKKTHEKLFQAEKLAAIGGMADGVAHQMRNRLNTFSIVVGEQKFEIEDFIRDNAELVAQNPALQKTFNYLIQTANTISNEVKRTAEMIKGVLNYARVEQKETFFSEFSLKEIIDNASVLIQVKHQIAQVPLETAVLSTDTVYGIKAQIMESIYNILDNAYEAIKEKTDYHLNEEEKKSFVPLIKLRFAPKDDVYVIEISDNGIGVKEEDGKKIFSPFFTTKSSYISGTGIGMYVVKRLIEENHKGKIWFESKYKEGITFYIELPKKECK